MVHREVRKGTSQTIDDWMSRIRTTWRRRSLIFRCALEGRASGRVDFLWVGAKVARTGVPVFWIVLVPLLLRADPQRMCVVFVCSTVPLWRDALVV